MAQPTLHQLIALFRHGHPMADIWARYPSVSLIEDNATDGFACTQMSAAFVILCHQFGINARLVMADCTTPFTDYHVWVAVNGTGIDWTARQYHNLHQPPEPALQDLDCPLIWDGGEQSHPIVGVANVEIS